MEIGTGTRALVSGASRGIGRAIASALAARGATVGLIARDAGELDELGAELPGSISLAADVTDRTALDQAVGSFVEQAGGLELAVANAGVAHTAPFMELEPERADQMVQVNVSGTLNLVRAALTPMLDRADGHVVVMSSASALRGFPWNAVYGATKAAQKVFAEALRHELSGTGVSVTTVMPGSVTTDLHRHEMDAMPDWWRRGQKIPPEDVARAVLEAVERDRREVHIPPVVRALALNNLAPSLTDRLLALVRGGSAAPRRY